MRIDSTNKNMGADIFQPQMQQGNDSFSRSIQKQIENLKKQMQDLGKDKEMPLEEKMKKRQELQQQIIDLQGQLRQHQIEQRREEQQKRGSSMDDMPSGSRQAKSAAKGRTGISSESMQSLISADACMDQVKVQGAVKAQTEGKAGVLKAEIKQDNGRGVDTKKKKEELAQMEAKASDLAGAQMEILSDANKKLEDASKADKAPERADGASGESSGCKAVRTDDKDKADKSEQADKEEKKPGKVSEPVGANVDVRL